ncbi:MAG: sugar transferase [Arenicellales bacterium]
MWNFVSYRYKTIMWFLAGDLVGLIVAFNLAQYWHIGRISGVDPWLAAVVAPVTLFVLYICEAYFLDLRNAGLRLALKTGIGVVASMGIFAVVSYTTKAPEAASIFWRGTLLVGFALFFVWATVSRLFFSNVSFQQGDRRVWGAVGEPEYVDALAQAVNQERVTGRLSILARDWESLKGKEKMRELRDHLDRDGLAGLIVATQKPLPREVVKTLLDMKMTKGLRIYDLVDFYEQYLYKLPVLHVGESWFALSQGFSLMHKTIQYRIKRMTDILLAVLALTLTLPLSLVVALVIKLDSKGPVIYRQRRVGLNAVPFELYKFRTMIEDAEKEGPAWAASDDPRVTRVGRVLRLTRMDELPQVWNVIKNEMSFIGPRPERPEFVSQLEQEIPYYDLRYVVKPGITGWAQVMYPYGSSVRDALEKLQYDLFYIKNYSLLLDAIIVLKTIRLVLVRGGR